MRVVHDGTWGFTSSPDVTVDEAVRLARAAVDVARTSRPLNTEPVELADEPVYADVTWVSAYDVDPFAVDPAEKVALFDDVEPPAARPRRRRPRRREPAAGARGQVLRRHRRHDDDAAAGAACSRG